MSAKHTPGPWVVGPETAEVDGRGRRIGVKHKTETVDGGEHCDVVALGLNPECLETMRANARLIAAAPELLAALEDLVHFVSPGDDLPLADMLDNARAAIAKARGEK